MPDEAPVVAGPERFPASHTICSADSLMRIVACAYHVGSPDHCELVRPGSSDSYILRSGVARYLLRLYGVGWRSMAAISHELDLMTHLSGKGVSVAQPMSDRQGNRTLAVQTPDGVRLLVVFEFAEGTPLIWRDEHDSRRVGRLAAEIHRASEDFVSSVIHPPRDLKALISEPLETVRPLFAHRAEDWHYLEHVAEMLTIDLSVCVKTGLDWGPCHGDLGNVSILDAPDGRLIAFDFDKAGFSWRALDFAPAHWLSTYFERQGLLDAFVSGYREVRPIADSDIAAVAGLRGASMLWSLAQEARSSRIWGAVNVSDAAMDFYLDALRTWQAAYGGWAQQERIG